MKISKLFHWLYALVMLLPIFAIGVTCGYVIFNKNAYHSYENEDVRTIQNVSSPSMLIDENTYTFSTSSFIDYLPNLQSYYGTGYLGFNYITIDFHDYIQSNLLPDTKNVVAFRFGKYDDTHYRLYLKCDDNSEVMVYTEGQFVNNSIDIPNFTFVYTLDNSSSNYFVSTPALNLILYEGSKLGNVFYDSVNKVVESPLFNWAYDSFLVAPFSYIVVLFSMPANSPIVMLLSYWLAISIIWLVFDLVMYLPLLVHRWLDKGVIE